MGRILITDRQARTADLVSCLVDMGASVLCRFVAAPRLISATVLSGLIPCYIALAAAAAFDFTRERIAVRVLRLALLRK